MYIGFCIFFLCFFARFKGRSGTPRQNKKTALAVFLSGAILAVLSSVKALAAVYGTILTGLERNLTFLATGCTDCSVHLTLASVAACCLAGITAGLAAKGLVGKALLSVELLLSCSEGELLSAILADQNLVVVHEIPQSFLCGVRHHIYYLYDTLKFLVCQGFFELFFKYFSRNL